MTAEVAIMNRLAVALAADSTVTIGGAEDRRKTYNTANKLFTLSKYHPIGAMIYGDASLMDVPWETIIKEYRKELQEIGFSTVREYADDVVSFLERRIDIFTEEQQRRHFAHAAEAICAIIGKEVDRTIRDREQHGDRITDAMVAAVISETIAEWKRDVEDDPILPHLGDGFDGRLANAYRAEIDAARARVLEKFVLSNADLDTLKFTIARMVAAGRGPTTGLVVAGFGEREMFPSVRTLQLHGIALGKLVFGEDEHESHSITYESSAALLPFAQKDVVVAFLTGCENSYEKMIRQMFRTVMEYLPGITLDRIVDTLGPLQEPQRKAIKQSMDNDISQIKEEFFNTFGGHKDEKHIRPLLDVIAALPKDELASMAEALVNLTSVKRKMSLDVETVGGPIDVAVISKGDGFIWIRRKHYFEAEFNPHFMETYFKR